MDEDNLIIGRNKNCDKADYKRYSRNYWNNHLIEEYQDDKIYKITARGTQHIIMLRY